MSRVGVGATISFYEDYATLLAATAQFRVTLAEGTEAQALAEAEVAITRHFSPNEPQPFHTGIRHLERAAYRGKRWATRQQVWVDRVASAWLIRRFIDPEACFVWLATPQDYPTDAIGFDFDGAMFTHTDNRVTFEVLLASFDLAVDPALTRLGVLVHSLDVGGVPVPEAAGFAAILAGVRTSDADDDQVLTAMTPVLNALYTAFSQETP